MIRKMLVLGTIIALVNEIGIYSCFAEDENRTIWFKDPYTILNEYKLPKEPDGSYQFLGKRYRKIDDISEEDIANIPAMQIVESTHDCVKFRSFAAYGSLSNVTVKGESFSVLGLSSKSKGGETGKPELPYYGQFIAVPKNVKVDLVIDNVKIEPVPGDYKIYPVQPSLPLTDVTKTPEFTIDRNAYKENKYIGGDKPICIAADVIIRGKRLIYVVYQPVLYNPAQNKLKAVWKAEWSLRYSYEKGSTFIPNNQEWEIEFSDSIGRMVMDAVPEEMKTDVRYKPLTASVQSPGQGYKINTIGNGADYLIITHDDFYDEITPLAEWKKKKGYRVKITKLSEIKAQAPSVTDIRNYIINAYNTWNPQPLYLLLVGDSQFLASDKSLVAHVRFMSPTDLWYAAIDGEDYFPDLFMGRLPCATTIECQTMVDKILLMEQNPPIFSSFYKNALAVGFFEDKNTDGVEDYEYMEACEAIRDFLEFDNWHVTTSYLAGSSVIPRKYSLDSMFHTGGASYINPPTFLSSADAASAITNAVNGGSCITYYMGHGGDTSWNPPSYLTSVSYYTAKDVQNLANGNNLSCVISISCFTAAFDEFYHIGDCLGETWLKKRDGGAYAFIGATGVCRIKESTYLHLGFYECLYPNFIETLSTFPGYKSGTPYAGNTAGSGAHLGQILNFGKMFMFDRYATGWVQDQFEKFHLFGCPEQEPRLVSPETLDVIYPAAFTTKRANFDITVTQSGLPVKGARVCLLLEPADFYAGITDERGKAHFEFEPNKAGEIQLTVTHKDALPFQGAIRSTVSDVTSPTGTIKINNDAQYATSASVTLTLSAADTGSGVAEMKFSNDNVAWSAYEAYTTSKSWELTLGNGTKTVYVKFKDVIGNESSLVSDTIISLAAAETPWKSNENGVLFSNYNLNDASTMGYRFKPVKDGWITKLGGYFKGTNVIYLWDSSGKLLSSATVTSSHNWSYADIAPVEVKANQTYTAAVYIKNGAAYRLSVARLPRTYGSVTIESGCSKKGSGYPSASAGTTTSATTMYGLVDIGYSYIPAINTTLPTGKIIINNDAQYATSASVTLNLSATNTGSGTTEMQFSNDSVTWSSPEAYAVTKSWRLPVVGDGDVDGSGKIISYDALLALKHACKKITLTENEFIYADVNGDGSVTSQDASYILKLSAGITRTSLGIPPARMSGEFTVYAKFKDNAGKWSDIISDSIIKK